MTAPLSQNKPSALHISEAEWRLMRLVWTRPGITSRQLIDILSTSSDWKVGTIKSLLSRLIQKGYLDKSEGISPYHFYATISQEEATLLRLQAALDPVCRKDRAHFLARLLASTPLSQADCQAIITQLEEQAKTAPETIPCQCPPGACQCHHSTRHGKA